MTNKKIKWLFYTVLVGLVPALSRFFVWLFTNSNSIIPFSAADFIVLGIVLHVSNMNEIEHIDGNNDWKTKQNGISFLFIAIYSVIFALVVMSEAQKDLINVSAINWCSVILSITSFVISFSVFDRISYLDLEKLKGELS